MTNDPFTLIRRQLLATLEVSPDEIVPFIAKRVVAVSAWILPDMSVNAIEEVMADLDGLVGSAARFGRHDIADELEEIIEALRSELPEANDCRIGINFRNGNIGGGCSGCTAADVADALGAIVAELQMMNATPDYVAYTADGVHVEFAKEEV